MSWTPASHSCLPHGPVLVQEFCRGEGVGTQAGEAPFPYALSALAAVVYIAATLGLAREGEGWRRVAWVACGTELVGVLVVGTLSVADAELFPDDTVWSTFGAGYGFLPLVLPFAGVAWLWRTRAPD